MKEKTEADFSTEFLKDYIEPKRFGSQFWLGIFIAFSIVMMLIWIKNELFKTNLSPKELKASLEFYDIHSRWTVKEKIDTKDYKGILLVPQIKFRIRNNGKTKLEHLYFVGVFTFMDISTVRGEGYQALVGKSLEPGASSKKILLTSDRGYRATSVQAFKYNRENWKRSMVKIYARNKNLRLTYVKTFYISRAIEGDGIDIRLLEHKKKSI